MLDVAWRYAPVVDEILKDPPPDRKIVEVGGGGEGLGWYLPDFQIVDCDAQFVKNVLPDTKPIRVREEKLPLPDNYTEVLVSVDMLEHLPRKKRLRMIQEMLRVARKKVILAVPTGKESLQAVAKFAKMFEKRYPGKKHQYSGEHLKHGHPEKEGILKMIKKIAPQARVKTRKNTNIRLWLFFQKIYLRLPGFYRVFRYRRAWQRILRPFSPLLDRGKTFRTVFYIYL
jgi:hypothetical protein